MRYYYGTYSPEWGIDSLFNDLFNTWSESGRRFPPADVYEREDAYMIEMEVAGYDEENIRLHVDRHVLSISSDEVKDTEEREYHTKEIHMPAFRRSFSLPESVDEGAIGADCTDGILTVTIPKRAKAEPKRIEVKINR